MSVAMHLAAQSECRMKHGAVIVKGGRVIAMGVNKTRNHPMYVSKHHIKEHCSVHAEVDAMRKANSVAGATIYIARVNRRGEARDSMPCKNCRRELTDSGIKQIVYTTSEES